MALHALAPVPNGPRSHGRGVGVSVRKHTRPRRRAFALWRHLLTRCWCSGFRPSRWLSARLDRRSPGRRGDTGAQPQELSYLLQALPLSHSPIDRLTWIPTDLGHGVFAQEAPPMVLGQLSVVAFPHRKKVGGLHATNGRCRRNSRVADPVYARVMTGRPQSGASRSCSKAERASCWGIE